MVDVTLEPQRGADAQGTDELLSSHPPAVIRVSAFRSCIGGEVCCRAVSSVWAPQRHPSGSEESPCAGAPGPLIPSRNPLVRLEHREKVRPIPSNRRWPRRPAARATPSIWTPTDDETAGPLGMIG
jgi:hypothetical protein